MGIYIQNEDSPIQLMNEYAFEKDKCFYCGKSLFDSEVSVEGIIIWAGNDGLLTLHPICAEELAVNLIQDCRSLLSKIGIKIVPASYKVKECKQVWHYKDFHSVDE